MSTAEQACSSASLAIPSVGRGKLVVCFFGSILAHGLFVYFSPVLFPRPLAATEPVSIEAWPDDVPTTKVEPEPAKPEAEKAPEATPNPVSAEERKPRPPPTEADVSRAVQHKGILRAFAALGGAAAGPLVGGLGNGLPSQGISGMGPAELPSGVAALDRGGEGAAGPATLGAIQTRRGTGPGPGMGGNGEVVGASVLGTEGGSVNSSYVSEGEVAGFVRARTGGIKACYESQLRREPTLRGRIRVRFKILQDGRVSELTALENTLASTEMEACVFNVIRGWRTPFRPSEAAVVEYPFVFSVR
jgi:hypothetical protein